MFPVISTLNFHFPLLHVLKSLSVQVKTPCSLPQAWQAGHTTSSVTYQPEKSEGKHHATVRAVAQEFQPNGEIVEKKIN